MSKYAEMTDAELELQVRSMAGNAPLSGRWFVSSVDAALTLIPKNRTWAVSPVHREIVDFELYPDDGDREGSYRFDEIVTVRTDRNKLARAICEASLEMGIHTPRMRKD